jgi:hypothetical protein
VGLSRGAELEEAHDVRLCAEAAVAHANSTLVREYGLDQSVVDAIEIEADDTDSVVRQVRIGFAVLAALSRLM